MKHTTIPFRNIQERRGSLSPELAVHLSILFAATFLATAGWSQVDEEPPLPDLFDEVIDVRVVNLEVVVTDRSGKRVPDLDPQDFELYVDGVLQDVQYFSEIRNGQAEARDDQAATLPGVDPGQPVGTNFLVYIDDNHTLWHIRKPLIENLIDDLEAMRPQDRMAIVVHRGTRLEQLTDWTSDKSVLEQSLSRLLDKSDFGGALKSRLRTARLAGTRGRSKLRSVSDDGVGIVDNEVFNESSELANQGLERFRSFAAREAEIDLDLAVAGVVATLRSFSKPQGRKVMLMMAGDWPIGAFRGDTLTFTNDLEITRPMVETANLLGFTLYPIWSSKTADTWRSSTLISFAEDSGGLALFKPKQLFEDVVADTDSYYWLGFSPNFARDDGRRDLDIRVKRPGLTVRSRDSFLDMSRSAQLTMMAQSALFFGTESTPSAVRLEFGEPTRFGLRKMDVPVEIFIPLDEITTIPVRGQDIAQLELRMATVDSNGQQAKIPTIPITLRGENREGDYFRYTVSLHLRRRPHELVVAVHDPISGKTMNARADISYRAGGVLPEATPGEQDNSN